MQHQDSGDSSADQRPWYVYIVLCNDGTLYTGITTDTERRVAEHNNSARGASYTRGRRPVKLVYRQPENDRSTASQREWKIKQLTRKDKETLIIETEFT
jgi:putative endonuclease